MASSSRRRIAAAKFVRDIEAGDLVRQRGHRGIGLVESVEDGRADVAWAGGMKSNLPLAALRRVRAVGAHLDTRRGE